MKSIIYIILLALLLSGCSSIVVKYENDNDIKEKRSTLVIKKDNKGNQWIELSGGLISPAVFKGNFNEDRSGDMTININKFYFLVNWNNGWTEGTYDATGKLTLQKKDNIWVCHVVEKPEILDIIQGRIRYYDDYLTDEKGQGLVKNRFERIKAINTFLKNNKYPEYFVHSWKNTIPDVVQTSSFSEEILNKIISDNDKNYVMSFYELKDEKYYLNKNISNAKMNDLYNILFIKYKIKNSLKGNVVKFLFPEIFPDSVIFNKDTKNDYKILSSKDMQIGDSIVWNKKYTDSIFPDHLKELRNSGTMLRDFEESLSIFYFEYNFDYYFDKILNGYTFDIKK